MTLLEGERRSEVVMVRESLALEGEGDPGRAFPGAAVGRPVANPSEPGISSDHISVILMVCGSERNVFYSRV